MKNWMLWSFVALALGFSVALPVQAADLESPLFTPAPEPKINCTKCLGLRSTAIGGGASAWGFGANCSVAQADLTNQLWGQADDGCYLAGTDGACLVNTIVTAACFWNGSTYQVDGYATYKCSIYIC